jgi:ubiquinone/menaquinone biosynthesis C-methylase UbiE
MAKVLNSFEELGKAVHNLHQNGCTSHSDPIKNWDMSQINDLLYKFPKDARILDMGYAGRNVLRLCYEKGFTNCVGIDLKVPIYDKVSQLWFMLRHGGKKPYTLIKMNLMKTTFPDSYFDVVVALSVIEHGVNIGTFLKEASRILKNKGVLFLTTDYWEPKINTDALNPYGLRWNVFSKEELEHLIRSAKDYGFSSTNNEIPPVSEPFVHYLGKNYTFASVTLIKDKN